jgi:hypothetical protein
MLWHFRKWIANRRRPPRLAWQYRHPGYSLAVLMTGSLLLGATLMLAVTR